MSMETAWIGLAAILGALGGAAILGALCKRKIDEAHRRLAEKEAELSTTHQARAAAEARVEPIAEQLDRKEQQLQDLQNAVAEYREKCGKLEGEAATQRRAFEEASQKLEDIFRSTATKVLDGQREVFGKDLEERKKSIGELLKPVDEKLKNLDEQIDRMERARVGAYEGLTESVKNLMESQIRLDTQAKNLVQALKSNNARGRWGEVQLKNLVESAGMLEYCDFTTQHTVATEDGKLRPDLVIRLPNQHQLVIDSKTPIGSYLEGHEEEDDAARAVHFQKFASHVRTHVLALADKTYWSQFQSAEFVVMFLPGEPFLGAAMRHDPGIFEFAFQKNVIIATPTTLLALLKAVAYGWRQEQLGREALKIADEGKSLHRNITEFMKHFVTMRDSIEKAAKACDDAEKKMAGPIRNTAVRLEKLGAKSAKALPKGSDDFEAELLDPELPEAIAEPEGELLFEEAGAFAIVGGNGQVDDDSAP